MLCDSCQRPLLKPTTTVLFGASLPQSFFEVLENDLPAADLVLVAGTSLVVSPEFDCSGRAGQRAANHM